MNILNNDVNIYIENKVIFQFINVIINILK